MTRTAFFTEPAPANASVGGRSLPASPASSSFLSRVKNTAQFLLAPSAAAAAADQPYPWLPARIRRNMSPRAQRLIRADY
ncbi:hypothetical protein [Polaromonas aquatica]|uniref:hypothetical protein n=1 Tax=Polaromonas aquatica TaxID=332657 RepID=UPI003D648FA6